MENSNLIIRLLSYLLFIANIVLFVYCLITDNTLALIFSIIGAVTFIPLLISDIKDRE